MPLGTYHRLTGGLAESPEGYTLVSTSGYWRLHFDIRPTQLVGTNVIIEGYRDGFNSLSVWRIIPEGGSWEDAVGQLPWWERLMLRWGWVRER